MKRLLNTLYVTTQGAYLARDGETVAVRSEGRTLLQVPIHTLSGIVCFGHVGCSPALMGLCGERQVALSFLTEHGQFLARVTGPVSGNVLLRREQYRRADDLSASAGMAWSFVGAKIANSRVVLLRAVRDRPGDPASGPLREAATQLMDILQDLRTDMALGTIRGHEGEAARIYFNAFPHLIVADKESFQFTGRNRRPPLDNVNALLSFVYTLLGHDVAAALEAVGLDPAVGFLHRDRPGRPGLALDLMEELRPYLADRLVLSLINRQQVTGKDFALTESGAVHMDEKARKTVLVTYQKRKEDELQHPFLEEKIAVGLLPHIQAMLLARHLRGDMDAYPSFVWR